MYNGRGSAMRTIIILFLFLIGCTTENYYQLPPSEASSAKDPPMSYDDENFFAMPGGKEKLNDGWSASDKLDAADRSKVISMQANFPESGPYTIQFQVNMPANADIESFNFSTEAIITWSVEGNFISRRITVADGASVTGVGQAASVRVIDTSVATGNIPLPGGTSIYEVGISVARGNRSSAMIPTFVPPDARAAALVAGVGNKVDIDIPDNSGINSVMVVAHLIGATERAIAPSDLAISQSSPGLTGVFAVYDYTDQQGNFIPIVPGVTRITLRCTTTHAATNIIYTVIFGVDG